MPTTDDNQLKLLLQDQATRRKGFEVMVRQYSEQLYWQVRRLVITHEDSNDVLQNAFIKAWSSLDSFHGDSKLITFTNSHQRGARLPAQAEKQANTQRR